MKQTILFNAEIYEPYQKEVDNVIEILESKTKECFKFRRLSFNEVVGLNGNEMADIPELPREDDTSST